MLDSKLPELQKIISTSKAAVSDRLMILEDELGAVMADVGSGDDVPGGPYVNVWSGVGTALENNQAVATLVGKIAQQVTATAGRWEKLVAKSNRVTSEECQLRTQVLSVNQNQRPEESKTNQIVGQMHTLALLLNQEQQDVQQHNLRVPNNAVLPEPSPTLMMPQGVPIEDAVLQLKIELQVVQSRLRSDAVCVGEHTFESYEDTLTWVTANCSAEDWQYVMDMPALYSLVRPYGQAYDVLLQEKSYSRRAGFALSNQARLDLSFKTKVPGIFGADKAAKNGHLFAAIDTYDKWIYLGIRQGFRDEVEKSAQALESSISKQMMVHLAHKGTAHQIFLNFLTESVQQLLKLHIMMDCQFLCYHTVLSVACDEGNWILSCKFAEAVFTGTCRARLIGSDAFSESGHVRCAMYLWAALQTHIVLQGYIEINFIAHPEVSSVVVENLIQTRVPMAMHESLKKNLESTKASVKAQTSVVEKMESKMGRQNESILKLQQEMRGTVKK
jgi:hypothetical protein